MFQCQDCTYKGKVFSGGVCPGCGSRKIKRLKKPGGDEPPPARRSYWMMLAWALWALLFYKALGLAGIL